MKDDASATRFRPRFGLLPFISLVALAVVVVGTASTVLRNNRLNASIASVEQDIVEVTSQLDDMKSQKLDSILVAQQMLNQSEAWVMWSDTVDHLLDVTPSNVQYLSYSASRDGRFSVNVVAESYDAAADLIALLDEDGQFGDVFVSAISQGTAGEDGGSVVTFSVGMRVIAPAV